MDDETRRGGDRVSYMHEVLLDYEGTKMTLNALDISADGVGVWGPASCPAGAFKLSLPLDDQLGPLLVDGKVARQFQSDGGAVWGITFLNMSESAKQRLEAYIARQNAAA
jgi:hypothetical protein